MTQLMGIDLGTSSVKVAVMNAETKEMAVASNTYEILIPENGYAEQNPDHWWQAVVASIKELEVGDDLKGISFSGQMHGLVMLDDKLEVIRPSIIWCDQRTKEQVNKINDLIGKDNISRITLNPLNTGFLIASLLWVKENEPENYKKIFKVMLPKDYIRFKLTGNIATEASDASSSLALDTSKMEWSKEILEALNMDMDLFPECKNAFDVDGSVTKAAAEETGLPEGALVAFGGGDQHMQALGNGLVQPGMASSTIGTGGQIFTPITSPVHDEADRLHTFCNAMPNTWCMMGASLSAGLSLRWLSENVLEGMDFDEFNKKAETLPPGSDGLIFLPYLIGERTPHMDPEAKGVFIGLTLKHTNANMIRSVMEGVTFSLRESLEIMKQKGVEITKVIASGGGAKSKLWKQIQADVYNTEIYTTKVSEQACYGAIIVAGVAAGVFESVDKAVEELVAFNEEVTYPIPENVEKYNAIFKIYQEVYKNNKDTFAKLTEI